MRVFFSFKKINAERYSALMISLATIATAWCAFQASVWSGVQTFQLAEANAMNRSAVFLHSEANQERLLEAQLLFHLANAYYGGNDRLTRFYLTWFPEVEYSAIVSLLDTVAHLDSFSLFLFSDSLIRTDEQARREYIAMSEERHAMAADANHTSDLYIFITVLFASSLFFSGMATKFEYEAVQRYFLLAGTGLVLVALVLILRMPIRF